MKKVIYTIINLKNGKQYIGSTTNFSRRKTKHLWLLNKNNHHSISLQNSWNKNNPKDYKFLILEELKNDDLIYEREQYWIDLYNTSNNKHGYNIAKNAIAPFGQNLKPVYQFSLNGKLLNSFNNCVQAGDKISCAGSGISACARGKYRYYKGYIWSYDDYISIERINLANNPVKRTKESKLKMSISASNRIDQRKPILQLDLNNNLIKEWGCTTDMIKETGYSSGYISDCLNKKHEKAYNFKWKFKNE